MRLSTTLLESFRRYRDGLLTAEQLTARITGQDRPTWRVELGRAYDEILQDPDRWRVAGGYRVDGAEYSRPYRFEEADVAPALALLPADAHIDPDRFQPKRERVIAGHVVVAKADYWLGAHIDEFKTRVGDYDPADYHDSVQWRFLLELFAADTVTYRVFRLADPKDGPPKLLSIETLPLHRYGALHDDCLEHVEACAQWVYARGLWSHLQQTRRRDDVRTAPPRPEAPGRPPRPRVAQAALF